MSLPEELKDGDQFKIEPALEADVEELVALETEAFGDRNPWSAGAFRWEIRQRPAGIWVIRDQERVVGYAQAQVGYEDVLDRHQRDTQTDGVIGSIAVLESHRGRGIGRRLLLRAVDYLRDQGVPRIVASTNVGNESMLRLFMSTGFEVAGTNKNFYDNGEDAIDVELRSL